jgi:hypothetical protein
VWLGFCEVEVDPSPKLHDQDVGVPTDVSVNCTAWPTAGEVGLLLNDAERAATTVTVRLALLEPEALLTARVTVLGPVVVKAWPGFCKVEVDPSPKVQLQDVGPPVDVSVNWTVWPTAGEAGLEVKEAASVLAGATVTVRVTEF